MWFWVVSNIAGSLLGAASVRWIKDTKVGVWGYKKFEDIANWAQERYGIDILDKEDIAWKTKYPKVAKKIRTWCSKFMFHSLWQRLTPFIPD